jgi:hypothetical protein
MNWKICLMGNHDEAVLKEAYGFNPVARRRDLGPATSSAPGFLVRKSKKEQWQFLRSLSSRTRRTARSSFTARPRPDHGVRAPLDCIDLTGGVPEKIKDIFTRFDRVCFAATPTTRA